MKINPNANPLAAFNRETPKPPGTEKGGLPEAAGMNAKPDASAARALRAARTGESPNLDREDKAPKSTEKDRAAPAGLEQVLARIKSMSEDELNAGRTQAMGRIERNLARYMEIQASAPPPAPAPAATPSPIPVADAPVSDSTVETAANSPGAASAT